MVEYKIYQVAWHGGWTLPKFHGNNGVHDISIIGIEGLLICKMARLKGFRQQGVVLVRPRHGRWDGEEREELVDGLWLLMLRWLMLRLRLLMLQDQYRENFHK